MAKNQISSTKWYLGGIEEDTSANGSEFYILEKGNKVYKDRSTNTFANVGLMYPSDYIYTYANGVDNECYESGNPGTPTLGWLFNSEIQWMISPYSTTSDYASFIGDTGTVGWSSGDFYDIAGSVSSSFYYSGGYYYFYVRPCVYLRSDIEIIGGDGSSPENAYILKS